MTQKIAIILSGSGYLDGAEIRESVLTLLALDSEGLEYDIFAPNREQHHVVNHITGEEEQNSKRNILEESARIARGKIQDLEELDAENYGALIMPGGFGVAKNFCDFAFKGAGATADELIINKIKDFKNTLKPIGAICIAPALLALIIGPQKPKLTIGEDPATASELEKLGATHENCPVHECVIDTDNLIVSTPAYMYDDAKLNDIYMGIDKTVKNIVSMMQVD